MTMRTILAVVLALVCGVSAAVGVNRLRSGPAGPAAKPETATVVVAAVDISRGMSVNDELLTVQEWPKELVPAGAILRMEDAKDRAVLTPLVKGEPLLEAKLAAPDAGRGMSPLVRPGMRAYTIQTRSDASGVAGFVLPGNQVDVLLTITQGGREDTTGGGSTSTLLQNVEVMAVNQELNAPSQNRIDANSLRSVTLLVTPEQAAMLSLAQSKGTLHLSLRNDADEGDAQAPPITMKQLELLQNPPLVVEPTPEPVVVPEEPKEEVVAAPEPVKPLRIRTLRKNSSSVIYIDPGPASPSY